MILDPAIVDSWHAHVYFNTDRRDAAWALREQAIAAFGDSIRLDRFHERPVGPLPPRRNAPSWQCQAGRPIIGRPRRKRSNGT